MSQPEKKESPHGVAIFHHRKGGLFRVIAADGAWGGFNNNGMVSLTFYSEHAAMPSKIIYPLNEHGLTINEPSFEGLDGTEREMEVCVSLSITAAIQVRTTLDNFIKGATENLEELKKLAEKAAAIKNK